MKPTKNPSVRGTPAENDGYKTRDTYSNAQQAELNMRSQQAGRSIPADVSPEARAQVLQELFHSMIARAKSGPAPAAENKTSAR